MNMRTAIVILFRTVQIGVTEVARSDPTPQRGKTGCTRIDSTRNWSVESVEVSAPRSFTPLRINVGIQCHFAAAPQPVADTRSARSSVLEFPTPHSCEVRRQPSVEVSSLGGGEDVRVALPAGWEAKTSSG